MTTRVQKAGGTTDAAIADQPLTAAGVTGSRTATHSVSTQLVGALITLRPAQTSLGYDQQGNRTSVLPLTGAATTLGYDQANRLTSTATYAYNGDGLRTAKTVSGITTTETWDTSTSIPTLLTDGTTAYIYGPDGLPIEQVSASGTLYYHHDQLGSTRALTNSSGAVVASYTYDPYGNLKAQTGTVDTPLRWNGQYQDSESGLYYLRARYYDPATGQFLSRDPLVAVTGSAYGYAADNPLNVVDHLGLWGFRMPDYYNFNLGYNFLSGRGGGYNVTITRYGKVFAGPEASRGTPGVSASARAGWINQCDKPNADQVNKFVSGAGATLSRYAPVGDGIVGPSAAETWGNLGSGSPNAFANEFGIGAGVGDALSLSGGVNFHGT